MVASVAKVNRVCVAAMVTDGTGDFLVLMVNLITKLPVLQWLPLLLLPRLLAGMVTCKRHVCSCCVCVLFVSSFHIYVY